MCIFKCKQSACSLSLTLSLSLFVSLCVRVCVSWGQIVVAVAVAVLNNFEFRLLVLPRSAGERRKSKKAQQFPVKCKTFFAALRTTSHGRAESFVYLLSHCTLSLSLSLLLHMFCDIARRHWNLLPSQSKLKQSRAAEAQLNYAQLS